MATHETDVPAEPAAADEKKKTAAGQQWQAGLSHHVPWKALGCLTGFAGCCVGLGVVLWSSDGQDAATWPSARAPVTPAVLLSLLVSVGNVLLAAALGQAYEIAWWLQAQRGAELRRLRFSLAVQSEITAVLSSRAAAAAVVVNRFAAAAVLALAVSVLDGPLIQRASGTVAQTHAPVGESIAVDVLRGQPPLLPANFSGYGGSGTTTNLLTPLFSDVSRAYSNRSGLALPLAACTGNTSCAFSLPGPGFDIDCDADTTTIPYDFGSLVAAGPISNITTFNVSLRYGPSTSGFSDNSDTLSLYSTINVTTTFKPDRACAGNLVQRTCVLRLAVVQYPLTVTDGVATLAAWQPERNETTRLVDRATLSGSSTGSGTGYGVLFSGSAGAGGFGTMLGGVFLVLNALYASTMTLRLAVTTSTPYLAVGSGQAASSYLAASTAAADYSTCAMAWDDPTADIVGAARALMLRGVLAYTAANASAAASPQRLPASLTRVAAVYASSYRYLAAAVACMGLQALAILALLAGWRHLGRPVSLDPFAIARALGAPPLQDDDDSSSSSLAPLDAALAPHDRQRMRYGEVATPDAAADSEAVHRLGLDYEERVGPIRAGVLY